jgi:PAS domain S-box-containing protein
MDVMPDIKKSDIYNKYRHILKTGEPLVIHQKLGDRSLAVQVFKLGDSPGIIAADITERKKAEEVLRQSEQRYRLLAENVKDIIWIRDMNLKLTYTSPSVLEMSGYSVKEVMSMSLEESLTPSSFEQLRPTLARVLAAGEKGQGDLPEVIVLEAELIRKDGSIVPVEMKVNLLRNSDGQPIGFLGVARDITERKKAEEALRGSEEKYRNLFNNAQVGLFRSRIADGKILECNDLLAKIFGYLDREEFIAKHITSEHYVDQNVRDQELAQMLGKGKVENLEALVTRRDGSPFWISYSATIYPERDYIEGVVIDITERKKVEEALKNSQEYLVKLNDSLQEVIFTVKMPERIIAYVNRSVKDVFGYELEECIGKTTEFLYSNKNEYGSFGNKLKEAIEERRDSLHVEQLLRRKNGEVFPAEITTTFFKEDGRVTQVISVLRDITERRQAEEALKESEEKHRALVDTAGKAGEGISIVQDVEGLEAAYVFVNDAFCEMTGYSREELLSMKAQDLIHPAEFSEILDRYRRRQRGENLPAAYELTFVRKDGTLMPVEAGFGVINYSGKVAIVAFHRDITERKRAEEALRNERDNLLNTLNAMKDGVYIISQQNDIVFANPSTKEEFGPYEGKKCYEYFHDFKEPCPWCNSREVIAGKIVRSEWFFPKTGKTYEVVHTPFREIGGSISKMSIIRDITERKRAEEALRKSEQTIRELAKASIRAHEEERQRAALEVHDRISQTLTGAFHQLQALETIPLRDAVAERLLSRASALLQECIGESRNIMKDLYSPVLSDFGIVVMIDDELHYFQEETGCRTRFDARCPNRLPRDVEVNAYRIFQEALMNIRKHAASAREVAVTLTCKNDVVSLQVVDNGPGFDVEAAMQSKRVGGLKGMQRRAELGGGTFEVASSPGKGTTVTVRLPYTSEPSAADTEKEDKKT